VVPVAFAGSGRVLPAQFTLVWSQLHQQQPTAPNHNTSITLQMAWVNVRTSQHPAQMACLIAIYSRSTWPGGTCAEALGFVCVCSIVLREGREGAAPALHWADDSHWARVTWSLIGQRGNMRVLPAMLHAARADADGNLLVGPPRRITSLLGTLSTCPTALCPSCAG
jgi:hypothetical protein